MTKPPTDHVICFKTPVHQLLNRGAAVIDKSNVKLGYTLTFCHIEYAADRHIWVDDDYS